MCGLVGLCINHGSGMYGKDIDTIEELLFVDSIRGEDATGVGMINEDGKMTVLKEAIDSYHFLKSTEWGELKVEALKNARCIIGHNRKRTIGTDVAENAHPFVIDNRYVFVHNGTLQNHKALFDTAVDSEALGMLLTRCEGDVGLLGEALGKVRGAYACVWYDQEERTLYMLRNSERPLAITEFKHRQGFAWSSEGWMSYGLAGRNNSSIEKTYQIEPGKLYSCKIHTSNAQWVVEDIVVKKATPPSTNLVVVGGKNTTNIPATIAGVDELSKSEFKRTTRRLIGTTASFIAEDCYPTQSLVNLNSPQTWVISGQDMGDDNWFFQIEVKEKTKKEVEEMYLSQLIVGTVMNTKYDKPHGIGFISLKNWRIEQYETNQNRH